MVTGSAERRTVITLTAPAGGRIVASTGADVITGTASADWLYANGGNDAVLAGAGDDWVYLGAGNSTVDAGDGADWIELAAPVWAGVTATLHAAETLIGSAGADWVNLGDAGNTIILAAVETLVSGANADRITLGARGNTTILAGIETLIGGTGQDRITLGNRGNTMVASGIETLIGGSAVDRVEIQTDGGAMSWLYIEGGRAADVITLAPGAGLDTIAYTSFDDGAGPGAADGCDVIVNFQADSDRIAFGGQLRAALDRDANGAITTVVRGTNGVNAGTDECVSLSARLSSLDDAGFASLRAALGTVATAGTARSFAVLATTASDSGLYVVSDDGNGTVDPSEIRMLARFNGAVLTPASVFPW